MQFKRARKPAVKGASRFPSAYACRAPPAQNAGLLTLE